MLPLICIDVDGTLVGPSHEPTDAVWAAAQAAIDRGQHLALSTGRGAMGPTLGFARRLDPDGWHMFHNGGALVHTGSGDAHTTTLADDVADISIEVADRNGWEIEFYSADDYTVESDSAFAVDHAGLLGVPHRVRPRADLQGAMVRLQLIVPLEAREWAETELAGAPAAVVSATAPGMPGVAFVSVTSPGVSKGTSIERLAAELGTTVDRVMMVGDGHNDVDAVAAAGHGVAMGNAVDAVKQAARWQVGHVDNDGLVEALELSASL